MTEQLHLEPRHREQLGALVYGHLPDVDAWVPGDHVSSQSHDSSGLDLVLRGPSLQEIAIDRLAGFNEALQKSTIPFPVKARDWAHLSKSSHREIEKKYVAIYLAASLVGGPGSSTTALTVTLGEWREFEFATLCDIKRGASPRPIHEWISEQGIPWVKIADASATDSRFIEHTKERIRPNGVTKSVSVFPGDLILSNSATPGIPRFVGIEACIHDGWLLLRDFRGIDKLFCYYLLLFEKPRLVRQGSGTVFTNLKTEILKRHRVKIPPLPEQRAIAYVLGTLDDKIELNRRMNETLEEMARALFKSWFVDFDPVHAKAALKNHSPSNSLTLKKEKAAQGGEWTVERAHAYLDKMDPNIAALFPDRFVDSELGQVPEGWEIHPASDLLQFNPRESIRKGTMTPYLDMAALPKVGPVPDTPVQREYKSGSKFKDGDTLFARITPCLENGKTAYVFGLGNEVIGTGSTEFIVIRSRAPRPKAASYLLARDPEFRACAEQNMIGTSGRQRANSEALGRYKVAAPADDRLWTALGNLINPVMDRIIANAYKSRSLAKTRDLLLPKLISGDIRLTDAEKMIDKSL